MVRSLTLVFLLSFFSFSVCAQNEKQQGKLKKVEALLQKNKIEKGEKKLIKLIEEVPIYGDAWDLLSNLRHFQFQRSKKSLDLFSGFAIVTRDEDGKVIKNDSLAQALTALLNNINLDNKARDQYLFTLRQATLYSNNAYKSDIYLRTELRDLAIDTTVSDTALMLFEAAEKEFKAKNFNEAAKLYQKAIDEEPDYFKALLYLGDSYYAMQNYIAAIKKFKKCIERFPTLLEPRKYLTDAYYKEGLLEDALDAAIESRLAYPDFITQNKLEDLIQLNNKKMAVNRLLRGVLPNKITPKDELIFNVFLDEQPKINQKTYWNFYKSAQEDVEKFCNEEGIITEKNKYTLSPYLEVYSWEKMLKNSDSKELAVAKEMKEKGYLDCYALITCFHDDVYDQYRHFVDNNSEKIKRYYNEIVIKN